MRCKERRRLGSKFPAADRFGRQIELLRTYIEASADVKLNLQTDFHAWIVP